MTLSKPLTTAAVVATTLVAPTGAVAAAVALAPEAAHQPPAADARVAEGRTQPSWNAGPFALGSPEASGSVGPPGSVAAPTVSDHTRWLWPLEPRPALLRRFEAPATRYGRGHRGIDLAASAADDVRSVDAGVVTHAATLAGRGTITVAHASGLRSTYEPVRARVRVGDAVARGDLLGLLESGAGHCGDSACLHLGALRAGGYVDPLPFLVRGVILLPFRQPR